MTQRPTHLSIVVSPTRTRSRTVPEGGQEHTASV